MQASQITDGVQQILQTIAAGKAEVCRPDHTDDNCSP